MDGSKGHQVVWSFHSKISLQAVVEYISLDSPYQARRIGNEIQDLGNSLGSNPWAYQECAELPTKTIFIAKQPMAISTRLFIK